MTDTDTIPSIFCLPLGIDLRQALADSALLASCIKNPSTDWRSMQVDAAIDRLDEVWSWLDWLDACDSEW